MQSAAIVCTTHVPTIATTFIHPPYAPTAPADTPSRGFQCATNQLFTNYPISELLLKYHGFHTEHRDAFLIIYAVCIIQSLSHNIVF